MAGSSRSPSVGMPGGSWTLEEEDAPQSSSVNETVAVSPAPISQEPYTVNSEITVLDPANLSEEVRLVPSPAGTETRVRISPEYMEVVALEQEQDETDTTRRHIRDSADQRRWRYLPNIFPEIKASLHSASSASRSPTCSLPSVSALDPEWEFPQCDHDHDDFSFAAATASASESLHGTQDAQNEPILGPGLGFDNDFLSAASASKEDDRAGEQMNASTSGGDVHGTPPPQLDHEITPTLALHSSGQADDPIRGRTPSQSEAVSDADAATTGGGDGAGEDADMRIQGLQIQASGTSSVTGDNTSTAGEDNGAATHGILLPEIEPTLGHGLFNGLDPSAADDSVRGRTPPESESVSNAATTTCGGDGVGEDAGILIQSPQIHAPSSVSVDDSDSATSSVSVPEDNTSTAGADNDNGAATSAMHGILLPEIAGLGLGLLDLSLVREGTEPEPEPTFGNANEGNASTSSNSPHSEEGEWRLDSDDNDDLSTSSHSHSDSGRLTSVDIPSTVTVRPSRSPRPSRSTAPSPSTGFAYLDTDPYPESPRLRFQELANAPPHRAAAAAGHDTESESLLSLLIRPATASAASASDKSEAEAEELEEYAELEYHDDDEYAPILTPSSLVGSQVISLTLSLDSSFTFPNEWEVVVAHPSSPNSFFGFGHTTDGEAVGRVIDPTSADGDGDEFVPAFEHESRAPVEAAGAEGRSITEPSQTTQSTSLDLEEEDDGTPDLDVAGHENADVAGGHSDDDGWLQLRRTTTPELPPLDLDLHSPSFTDAVLSSPLLHLRKDGQLQVDDLTRDTAPDVSALAVRAQSSPNVERRSILWAPQNPILADSKGKGKGRRTRSDHDAGFARVELGVQTDSQADKFKARCARLEKELRIAQAKAVRLASLERREAETRQLAKLYSWGLPWGFPSNFEDVIA
ncbi:hypothetical protein B0H12DRAFT_1159760 [Mycena haematopus]|nr:hypothetical protein B0H12DRAFT_1159760 [Mycena haematopus]